MPREIVFETRRLFACQWRIEDAQQAFGMYGNPAVMRHLGDSPATNLESVEKRVQFLIDRNAQFPTGMGSYPVFEKATRKLVGNAMIKPLPDFDNQLSNDIEVGWHLNQSVWGRGYASEFGNRLLSIGFLDLGLSVLHAVVGMDNQASSNVAKRIGMTYVGTTEIYYGGEKVMHFQLGSDDYFRQLTRD